LPTTEGLVNALVNATTERRTTMADFILRIIYIENSRGSVAGWEAVVRQRCGVLVLEYWYGMVVVVVVVNNVGSFVIV